MHRVVRRRDQLLVVVIVGHVAVAAPGDPQADAFPQFVRRAVLAHLAHADLAGPVGRAAVVLLVGGGDRGGVDVARMDRVQMVLQHEFPVAVIGVARDAAGDLHVALRRPVDQVVEGGDQRAEKLAQRRAVRGQAGEDEAAIHFGPRHFGEAQAALRAALLGVALRRRHGEQGAVQPVGPAVIGADELGDGAPGGAAHGRSAMGAAVEQHPHAAVALAHHEDRLPAHLRRHEIARARDLAVMAEQQPGPAENPFHLQVEDAWIGVGVPMHPAGLHQLRDPLGRPHGALVLSAGQRLHRRAGAEKARFPPAQNSGPLFTMPPSTVTMVPVV